MSMVKVKTAELVGAALDWAVAQIDGVNTLMIAPRNGEPKKPFALFGSMALSVGGDDQSSYAPSTCWHCGGPLIEKYKLTIHQVSGTCAIFEDDTGEPEYDGRTMRNADGDTVLIAACRAIVSAKLGDEVEVPEGLMP